MNKPSYYYFHPYDRIAYTQSAHCAAGVATSGTGHLWRIVALSTSGRGGLVVEMTPPATINIFARKLICRTAFSGGARLLVACHITRRVVSIMRPGVSASPNGRYR